MLSGQHDRAKVIAEQVKEIYTRASIPSVDVNSIVVRIKRLIADMRNLDKYPQGKRSSAAFQEKVSSMNKLFDVCTCKCYSAGISDRTECKCNFAQKIPALEWDFWVDQYTDRKCFIGSVDRDATSKLRRKLKSTYKCSKVHTEADVVVTNVCGDTDGDENSDDDDARTEKAVNVLISEQSSDESVSVQNRNKYPALCKAIDRCKISNRDACMIANAVLQDLNLLSDENMLDPSKIRRQRKFWRQQEVHQHRNETKNLVCIGFDGKQDVALVQTDFGHISLKEEHYAILSFPGDQYVDHIIPQSSQAKDVAAEIMSVINDTDSTESLQAVICDGTNNNTGKNNGIIRKMEEQLGRSLQWLVCELHTNELPFRKYFSDVDGGQTTGPATSSGVIARQLNFNPKDIPLADFVPVPGQVVDVPSQVSEDLSTDQVYFLRACLTVQVGYAASPYTTFLQCSQPGNISHARWLTKASRVLRLYMSQAVASKSLQRIVSFIVNVYGPTWFQIKCHSSCQDGARNFFFLMKQCQQLSKSDQTVVFPVLQNNCYFAHPENVLIAAVADDDLDIRRQAIQLIIAARENVAPCAVRLFDKNSITLNFSAQTYFQMIDWARCQVTPPPLLSHLSNDELLTCQQVKLPAFPCHSQAVERTVKDISSSCSKVCGHDSRHGMVLLTKKARLEMPKVDTKSDFK